MPTPFGIEVLVPLPAPILFDPRALSPPARTSLDGVAAEIRLPGVETRGASHDLTPPQLTRPLTAAARYHDWGFTPRWDYHDPAQCQVRVEAVVVALASAPEPIAVGYDGYNNLAISRWLWRLGDWVEVVAGQDLDHSRPLSGIPMEPFDAWNVLTSDRLVPLDNRGTYRELPGRPLIGEEWNWILARVERGDAPSAVHLWLRNARAELHRKQLRHAVMEAATVIESCVWTLLNNLGASAIQSAEKLTLGGLVGRAIQRGIPIPNGFQKPDQSLLDCRNNALHRDGIEPTRDEAARMVEVATDLLERVEPLGAPRSPPPPLCGGPPCAR